MEAVRVIAAGYPDRVPHFEILGRFGTLLTAADRPDPEREGEKAAAVRLLVGLGIQDGEYVPGNTKMFLKVSVTTAACNHRRV